MKDHVPEIVGLDSESGLILGDSLVDQADIVWPFTVLSKLAERPRLVRVSLSWFNETMRWAAIQCLTHGKWVLRKATANAK